jgi:hypothetical protein
VTQLLNEVASRGPKIISATSGPWLAEKKDYSALGDPCDFFCTFLTCKCETANVFSQLSGVPFWFAMCSNFCQVELIFPFIIDRQIGCFVFDFSYLLLFCHFVTFCFVSNNIILYHI